ncbi:MAG: hypothetical protein UV56_C0024G0005 [Candidatus Woesebacteria bacterium GW2011_GWC1_43_10b]|uniref:Uncharacterized protein n=1 Tax=Candidatus Woesebacteria bacterium GW2011_GWC1_43_10b TaxID=1618585 RepID=A0A0G1C3I2_9BACT|nr:MAG: hypothetical protein UV56_C0024G0005 [Candidatus Woesebacteria bacterium GW2011_GWC1_43_10b]
MTKEKDRPQSDLDVGNQGRIARAIEERKEWFESLQPLCPQDGLPSKFERYQGAYTRVHGIFKCPSGHEFNYSSRLKNPPQK